MRKKALALTPIFVVLCSLAVLSCYIPKVNASLHISPDGTVSGTSKIHRNGDVYTLTDDVYMDIRIEKSNITVDGAGFKLEKIAPAGNWGITFSSEVHDVTIKNLMIIGFGRGIMLTGSGNAVTGCTIIDCFEGILLDKAEDSIITDNTFVNSTIRFLDSSNNLLRDNRLENSWIGTSWQKDFNDVDSSNTLDGKPMYYLVNQHGLLINPTNYPEIGCLILIGCTDITIRDIVFPSQSTNGGVAVTHTSNSKIINNTFTDLWEGIVIYECSDTTVSGNHIVNNEVGIAINPDGDSCNINITRNHFENNEMGISLSGLDIDIHHNNFVNNTQHVYDLLWHPLNFANAVTYVWDDGEQGNFWSDYNATDADGDGLGDTPYVINQRGNNIDRYPLMEPIARAGEPESTLFPSSEPTPEAAPFPNTLVAAASVAIVAIVGVGLMVYFKKRKQ